MGVLSLDEQTPGRWRIALQCIVCQSRIERSLPRAANEEEHAEWRKALRRLMRARQAECGAR